MKYQRSKYLYQEKEALMMVILINLRRKLMPIICQNLRGFLRQNLSLKSGNVFLSYNIKQEVVNDLKEE